MSANQIGDIISGIRPDGTETQPMMTVAFDDESVTFARLDGVEAVFLRKSNQPIWQFIDKLYGID